jgi:hypothetical protein
LRGPDQRTIVRPLGVRTASAWLCFDSALLTAVTRLAAPLVGGETAFSRAIRRRLARVMPALRFGSKSCRVLVQAEGRLGRRTLVREFSLSSRSEARVTGLLAAEAVHALVAGERRAGVRHLEQVVSPRRVLERLRDAEPGTTVQL